MSVLELLDPRRAGLRRTAGAAALVLALGLGVAACGDDDDGADVRASGPGACDTSGSASGSASGSTASAASGSASGAASGSCPSGSGSGSGSASGTETECEAVDGTNGVDSADATVDATLDEYSIELASAEVAAGAIGFSAENAGDEDHEIVIARAAPEDITVVDGAPDEAALGDALIGEIEAFPAGGTCEGTFELTAGDYVLFCALVEEEADGTIESHYEEGMVTTFTVR